MKNSRSPTQVNGGWYHLSIDAPENIVTAVDYFLPGQGDSLNPNLSVGQNVRVATVNSDGGITATATDSRGTPLVTLHPLPNDPGNSQPQQQDVTTYTFDPALLTAVVTVASRPVSAPATQKLSKRFSANGTLLAKTDDADDTTQDWTTLRYDERGNLQVLTDPGGSATRWDYDAQNRPTYEYNATGFFRKFQYNSAGEVAVRTDRDGDTRSFKYDVLGRVDDETLKWKSLDGSTQTQTIDFQYDDLDTSVSTNDGDGRLKKAIASDVTVELDFDDTGNLIFDQVINVTTGLQTRFSATYDGAGNRSDLKLRAKPSASASFSEIFVNDYAYDALNRLKRVDQTGGPTGAKEKAAVFDYDSAGRLESIDRFAGTNLVSSSDYDYNDLHQLTGLVHTGPNNTTLASYGLLYDALGRLDILTSTTDGTADYDYDAEGQLTDADYTFSTAIDDFTQTYDSAGNRTGGGYATGLDNQTTSDGTYTYTYDREGNRKTRTNVATNNVTSYEWDARGRLVSVETRTSGDTLLSSTTYTYDPLDRRVARSVDADGEGSGTAVVSQYANDGLRGSAGGAGDHVAAQFDESGTLTNRYLHGVMVDQVLADEQFDAGSTSETNWFLSDHQGTVRDIARYDETASATAVVNHRVYDAFGTLISETDSTVETDFGFAGRQWDEQADLYYNRARYYDPELGQFISKDPIGFAAGDANLYRYVGNGPTNATDPSGLVEYRYPPGAKYANGRVSTDGKSFIMNKAVRMNAANGGRLVKSVPIVNGRLVFDSWSRGDVIVAIVGENGFDQRAARAKFKQQYGMSPPKGTLFHHDPANIQRITTSNGEKVLLARMQAVPKDLNSQAFHKGAASIAREHFGNDIKNAKVKARAYNKSRLFSGKATKATGLKPRKGFATPGSISIAGVTGAATFFATYAYEHHYLGSAKILQDSGESLMIAKLLDFSAANGRFPDRFNTPFPSLAELRNGVELTLVLDASLKEAIREAGFHINTDVRKTTILDGVLLHVVDRNGKPYYMVQQILPEPDENGVLVRPVLSPGSSVGIGTWRNTYGIYQGQR